jgi:type I restriction enzyme S subunit
MQELLAGERRLPGFASENGYKQTEVGLIPEDWNAKTLGDVMIHCFSGATPSRSHPDYYKGSIRWITSGELNYNIINDTAEKISKEAAIRTNLKLIPKNTFLMAITGLEAEGTRGSCGIVGEESTTNQSCMAIFPTNELLTKYLFHYYVLRGKALALKYCQGTKQQSYTAKIVKLIPIPLPPREEQCAIVAVLSDMDADIAMLVAYSEKMRALKQGMMQELLTGRIRLVQGAET